MFGIYVAVAWGPRVFTGTAECYDNNWQATVGWQRFRRQAFWECAHL